MLREACMKGAVAVAVAGALLLVPGCGGKPQADGGGEQESEMVVYERPEKVEGAEAITLLQAGNERFVKGEIAVKDVGATRREELAKGQEPFAVVVTCSDSRVPPEIVFDQALGDVFVVRVAGNVIDEVALGSVEYAVEHLESPAIIVLGHESCGAVKATVAGGKAPGSVGAIVKMIQPAVDAAKKLGVAKAMLPEEAADENVANQLETLKDSRILAEKLKEKELVIKGAKYHLDSGEVEWFK